MRKWVKKHKKRIFAFILSLVFGVGSAFALSCPAFADSDVPYDDNINFSFSTVGNPTYIYTEAEWSSGSWRHYGVNGDITGALYYPAYGVRDIYIRRNLQLNTTVYSFNSSYKGYVRYQETFNIDDFCKNYGGVDNEYIKYVDVSVETEKDFSYFDRSISTFTTGDAGTTYWNNKSGVCNFSADTNVYFQGDYLVGTVFITLIYHFKLYYVTTLGFSNGPGDVNFNTTINNSSLSLTSRFSRAKSDKYYLYNIDNKLDNVNNNLQGDDQILEDIEVGQSLAEDRIGTVDSIIASVAPDADDAILDVSTVMTNNGTFWSNQRNASLFWKEIISDMYDSTITGYLGVGLSIVLIIILFVFILRL